MDVRGSGKLQRLLAHRCSALTLVKNNHEWGDQWNGEDLSVVSIDDSLLPSASSLSAFPSANPSTTSFGQKSSGTNLSDSTTINPSNLKEALKTPQIQQQPIRPGSAPGRFTTNPDKVGYRAAEAWVRPSPIATVGSVIKYGFDLKSVTFTFSLTSDKPAQENVPTEIFLPEFHFRPEKTTVEVSGGRWRIHTVDVDGEGMQVMKWWHGAGEQSMTVKGMKRKAGALDEEEEVDSGYLETMRENCLLM